MIAHIGYRENLDAVLFSKSGNGIFDNGLIALGPKGPFSFGLRRS